MKKRVLRSLLCLSLSVAMVLGEEGFVLADTAESAITEAKKSSLKVLESETAFEEKETVQNETPDLGERTADALGKRL